MRKSITAAVAVIWMCMTASAQAAATTPHVPRLPMAQAVAATESWMRSAVNTYTEAGYAKKGTSRVTRCIRVGRLVVRCHARLRTFTKGGGRVYSARLVTEFRRVRYALGLYRHIGFYDVGVVVSSVVER